MRVNLGFRAGTALVALAIGNAASAQSTLPPEDVAQTPAAAGEGGDAGEIVVTGSRIRRNPLDQDSPITFVDKSDMAKTGLNSVNDVLQRLPSVGGGLNGKFNTSGNNGNPPDGGGVGAGSAEVDLRYLGSKRTLVLVDGLRMVNGAAASGVPGAVDLNVIPESMIERVEVLQDGASAIYGSDAISGVVNIITKRGQDGFDASAQVGVYDEGDGLSKNVQASWGNGKGGPTEIVIGANYVDQRPVFAGDRDISAFPTPYATSCSPGTGGCSSATPLGRFIVLGQNLTLKAPVIGRAPTLADYRNFISSGPGNDRFNFAPYNYILTPLTRIGAFANVHQELGPDMNLTVKVMGNRRKSKNQAAPVPIFIGQGAGNGNLLDTITVDVSNPFNPFGVTLNSSNYDVITRRPVEFGSRRFSQKVDTVYATATLDGKLGANWFWDINGIWGNNKAKQTFTGNINSQKLQQALGPVAACAAITGCTPFNIFGGEGSITQAMIDFVGYTERNSSQQKTWGGSGNISGSLAELSGGALGLAVGVEYRDLSGRFDPDPITAAGFSADIPSQPARGGYNVKEAYAELDAPFTDEINLTGAVRWSDYSRSGSKLTYKAGVNYKPHDSVRLRASYGTGLRAPTIGELFGGLSRFDATLLDPCASDNNPTPDVAANCAAAGVPGNFVQLNPQLSVVTGGNDQLKPETSRGLVIGGVWSPVQLDKRLSMELNFYRIRINGAIQSIDAAVTLDRCYSAGDQLACAQISRAPNGQISLIRGTLLNIAGIRTSGLDYNVTFRLPQQSFGQVTLTSNSTALLDYRQIVPTATGTATIDRDGTEVGSPYQGFPRLKSVNSIDLESGAFGGTLVGRYTSSLEESDGHRIKPAFYLDTQLRWSPNFMKDLGLAVGVNNLLDKDPPKCTTCGIPNYDPNLYDIPGRYFYGRVSVKM